MDFASIKLQYQFRGQTIMGILTGNILRWKFTSNSEAFTSYFPERFMTYKIILSGSDDPRLPIVEMTLTAIDGIVEANISETK